MKILIINVLYPPIQVGGAEKAAQLLADAYAKTGDQVAVISLHPGSSESVEQRGSMRIYRLPMDNLYWPFGAQKQHHSTEKWIWHLRDVWNCKAARRIGRILDREKPDIVHTHNLSGLSVSVWKEVKTRRIRLVHTLHDYYMLCPRSNMFRGGRSCEKRCMGCQALTSVSRLCSKTPDAVVSVSEAVLQTHRRYGYFRGVPSFVIYNIEHSMEQPSKLVETCRQEDAGDLIFGFIGKLSGAKGIAMLLQATTLLSRGDWRLKIAGKGDETYVNELKRKFSDSRIEWLGFTDSQSFYASIDVTVVPSLWRDPLPYVAIESFAAGKGVICAESGGLPELAILGKTVKTYPPTDLRALVRALEEVLSSKGAWRSGGFKTPDSKVAFMEETVTRRYREVYQPTF